MKFWKPCPASSRKSATSRNSIVSATIGRYHRQTLFAPLGEAGQKRLGKSTALILGVGALGSRSAELLARAGLGRLILVDRDFVEWSNLQRQTLFTESDAKDLAPKAVAAARHLRKINSDISIEERIADIHCDNILKHIEGVDLVVDGTDNLDTRYLLNDACLETQTPWIYGACVAAYGVTMTILPGETACLRCAFPEPPGPGGPTCDTAGILAPVAARVAAEQAAEALKLLSGNRGALRGSVLAFDQWKNWEHTFKLGEAKADCPACARGKREFLHEGKARSVTSLCGANAVQIRPSGTHLNLEATAQTWKTHGEVKQNTFLIQADFDGCTLTLFSDGRALVSGTCDESEARKIYSKYVGN